MQSMKQKKYLNADLILEEFWTSGSGSDNWSSRGNRSITYTQQLCVPKKEFYISNIHNTKNSDKIKLPLSKLKRTGNKSISDLHKNQRIVYNDIRNKKKCMIENYFHKKKYIGNRFISPKTNFNTERSHDPGNISDITAVNAKVKSAYSESDSTFNIDVALQLSSQCLNMKSSKLRSEESISESIPLKKYIHKKPFMEGKGLSNNWITLKLYDNKKSANEECSKSTSACTVKTPTAENSCITNSNKYLNSHKTPMSRHKENYSISKKREHSKCDWISRGCTMAKNASHELSVTAGNLFKRNSISSRNIQTADHLSTKKCSQREVYSSQTLKRKLSKTSTMIEEKKSQASLYDYFEKKYGNVLKQKNHWNKNKKPDSITNKDKICDRKEIGSESNSEMKVQHKIDIAKKIEEDLCDDIIFKNDFPVHMEKSIVLKDIQPQLDTDNMIQSHLYDEKLHEYEKSYPSDSLSKEINEKFEINNSENHDSIGIKVLCCKENLISDFNCLHWSDKVREDITNSDLRKFNCIIRSQEQNVEVPNEKILRNKGDNGSQMYSDKKIENKMYNKVNAENDFPLCYVKSTELEDIQPVPNFTNPIEKNHKKQIHKSEITDHSRNTYRLDTKKDEQKFLKKYHNSVEQKFNKGVSVDETVFTVNHSSQQDDNQKNIYDEYNCSSALVNIETFPENQNVCKEGQNKNISINRRDEMDCDNNIHNEENSPSNIKLVESFLPQEIKKLQEPFTKFSFTALEDVSSPILLDPECQEYLRSLVLENNEIVQKESSHTLENNLKQSDSHLIPKKVFLSNPINSEDNNFLQFWENILSQNQADYSQKLYNFTEEPAALAENISQKTEIQKTSQEGSEIFQYILSQDCAESASLMTNALKNMNNLSQKIFEKRNLIVNCNLNANKLLWMAFKIYAEHKERSFLLKSGVSDTVAYTNLGVLKKRDGFYWTYKVARIFDVEAPRSGNSSIEYLTLWNQDISTRSTCEADEKILLGLREICLDKSYLYVEMDDGPHKIVKSRSDIIHKIGTIFERILTDFDCDKSPYLEIRRQTFEDCIFVNDRLVLKLEENPKMIKVKYQNTSSLFKFCIMMYVLAKVLQALETNSKTTRRELYYQVKLLISKQSYIDRAVKAVSCMLRVGPWDLNIVAHKGMVYGDLKITMSSNEIVDCNLPGTLIPQDVDEIVELKSSAFFILVVEKESIFYKILEEKLPDKLVRPFIMLTGKGFPDLNTQLFLKKLWMVMSIPIFIFTDADPHGVNIMMTYRFGSLANAHLSQQLAIPKARWLGVFPSEVVRLNADKQILTEIEKNVIRNLLKTPYMNINKKIKEELKFMLESGYKAGIEGIIKNPTFLREFYFPLKFHNKDLI